VSTRPASSRTGFGLTERAGGDAERAHRCTVATTTRGGAGAWPLAVQSAAPGPTLGGLVRLLLTLPHWLTEVPARGVVRASQGRIVLPGASQMSPECVPGLPYPTPLAARLRCLIVTQSPPYGEHRTVAPTRGESGCRTGTATSQRSYRRRRRAPRGSRRAASFSPRRRHIFCTQRNRAFHWARTVLAPQGWARRWTWFACTPFDHSPTTLR
jgi:hypothetical protein